MKNPILFFVLIIFSIVNILDSITGYFILPGETNPIYLLFGKNFFIVLLFKCLIVIIAWLVYNHNKYTSNLSYYSFVLILTFGILLVSLGIYSNIIGITNPIIIEQSKNISDIEKIQLYGVFTGVFFVFPVMFTLIAFIIYEKSYEYAIIEKNLDKKRKVYIDKMLKKVEHK